MEETTNTTTAVTPATSTPAPASEKKAKAEKAEKPAKAEKLSKLTRKVGMEEVPISTIVCDSSANPRQLFSRDELNSLVASIKQHGILEPLGVYEGTDLKPHLIYGERRLRASKVVGLKVVPVTYHDVDEQGAKKLRLLENIQRADLSVMEEAQGLKAALESGGITAKELAESLGKSAAYISQRMAIFNLAPEIQAALAKGEVNLSQLREMMTVKDHKDQLKIFRELTQGGEKIRSKDVKDKVTKQKASKPGKPGEKKRGRPEAVTEAPRLNQNLDSLLEQAKNLKLTMRSKGDAKDSIISLYTAYSRAKTDERKNYVKGQIAYAEWIAGLREDF